MTHAELLDYLRERAGQERGGKAALAKELGISRQYLNDVLSGYREPGKKVLDALGLERVVTYARRKRGAG